MDGDAELADRIGRGDEAAMAQMIERYQPLIRRVIFNLLDDARDREEVCQDTLIRVIRHIGGWRGEAGLSTWIARIAHRSALQRRRLRRLPLVDDLADASGRETGSADRLHDHRPDAHAQLEHHLLEARVRAAVRRLPPLYRSAITLYYLEELSVAEVAQTMDLPEGTVKSYLFRARSRLKHDLEE